MSNHLAKSLISGCKLSLSILLKHDFYIYLLNCFKEKNIEVYEQFKIVLLNRCNKALEVVKISSGGVNRTVVDLKLVFASAMKARASDIILAQNHQSGNLNPSQQDIQLTKKIVAAGEILDIKVINHLIVTKESFKSFFDEG